jgi:putative peptide zinc metalloprotease protein
MIESQRLFANPLLEISDFDSDSCTPLALCVLPSADEPVRFAMPALYMELVRQFDGDRTEDEAIGAFLERHPGSFDREWLRRLVRQSLLPKGVLVHDQQDPARVAVSSQPKRAFLYIKLPIFPPGVVEPVARCLSFMFKWPALLLGILAFVASHVYFYAELIQQHDVDFNRLNAGGILFLMLLSTLGTLCHEFGHAGAAAHYGCRRMTIGWGLYIIYTVLWTNVSEAWRLPRRQRALIDVGGVYFESLFQLLMMALYLKTGNLVFLFAFVMIDVNIVMTLNPFLRMDGYWLISDLFGIVNLRRQQTAWVEEIAAKLFGGRPPAVRSSLSRRAKWTLAVYSVSGTMFLAYLLTVIFKFVILNVAGAYPAMLQEFWGNAAAGMTALELLGGFFEIFWRTLMLLGATLMLLSLGRGAIRMVARIGVFRSAAQQSAVVRQTGA